MDCCDIAGPAEEQDAGGDEVQSGQGGCRAFVFAGQMAEVSHQGEGALDDPLARQQDEDELGLGQLHHLHGDAVISCRLREALACVWCWQRTSRHRSPRRALF